MNANRIVFILATLTAASWADAATTASGVTSVQPVMAPAPCAAAAPILVEGRPGYNCWPMIQNLGRRLVCAYSIGFRHNIGDGAFGTYARTSDDGGLTWSDPVEVLNDPNFGEEAVGKGLDENGDMLLWVRRCAYSDNQVLFRTHDGKTFEKIAVPKLDPLPTQVTDVIRVPGVGLLSLWFRCTYGGKVPKNCWGTLVSADNGRTWTQKTVEGNLPIVEAATEPAVVCLKDGRILGIARSEGQAFQYQLTSLDGGVTWTKRRTNISDVCCSTPSLTYSPETGMVFCYYYQRGRGLLKRRAARAAEVFDAPLSWPEPDVLAAGSPIAPEAGNANAVSADGRDYVVYYSGVDPQTRVYAIATDSPAAQPVPSVRSLAGTWRFFRENGPTNDVTVPHDWAIAGPFDPKANGHQGKLPWKGVGHYSRTFVFTPAELDLLAHGARVYLEFEGVMARPAVTVNGNHTFCWDYGYMGFWNDITGNVRITNRLDVVADTTTTTPRWYPGAGIYRDVKLHVKGLDAAIPWSVRITTPKVTRESAHVRVEWARVGGGTRVREFDVPSPRLWDVDDPYLYTVEIDGEPYRYGIRTAEWTADDGFHLNGRRVQLKGVCLHADLGPLGAVFDRDAAKRELLVMKDMGANAVRTSHNAPAPGLLDLCDELGLLVYDECFDKWDGTAGRRPDEKLEPYVERNLAAWVRRDRNHPSVICWSIANELMATTHADGSVWNTNGVSAARVKRFCDCVRRFDATRPVTVSHNFGIGWGCLDAIDLNDGHYGASYRESKKRHPKKPTVYSETVSSMSSYGYYQFPRPVSGDDYAVEARECDGYDETWAASLPEVEFLHLVEDPYCAGEFIWTGVDYLGEPTPYLMWQANPAAPWHYQWKKGRNANVTLRPEELARSSYFGACDLTCVPKDRFYLYRSVWNGKAETCHVLPHWNWGPAHGVTNLPVVVYANGDEAEVFLNGRSLGRRRKAKRVFTWTAEECRSVEIKKANYRCLWKDVAWEPGELRAVSYRAGKKVAEDVVRTCGAAKAVKLTADPYSCGRTLYVQVDVVDAAGVRDPWATNRVSFALKGPGRILAVGNGSAHAHEAFGDTAGHSLFYGKAMVIVRRDRPGELVLAATADGLDAATLSLR